MKNSNLLECAIAILAILACVTVVVSSRPMVELAAQNPSQNQPAAANDLQQRLGEVKQAAAENKQALAHYSWQQQETVAVKGNVKDTKMFQVHLGPDGKQQKVEMANMPQSSGPSHGLKGHIKEKKKEEYQEYGRQIGALAQQYSVPDPERLQQAYQQGNLMLGSGGMPGEVKMIIKSYVKPNDQVTLLFNRQSKAIQSLQINTYLNDPKDAVTISAQYSKLAGGPSHVSTMQIHGVSKDLLITTQNSNYQRMM
jgi:hypothetical protein